jgi:hypothetical protein
MRDQREQSSFRDPAGYVFYKGDQVFRSVSHSYKPSFDKLIDSGLYDHFIKNGWLIRHEEIDPAGQTGSDANAYKILRLPRIPFISYPYEWCFSQLRSAALLTLDIQLVALEHGMTLKDASAFNVQFYKGKPVFIDSLSFEEYKEGEPWKAYRQFCKHFLAPLSLISNVSHELYRLSEIHLDGIPLSLASELLPWKTKLIPFYQMHIHYHAKLEQKHAGDTSPKSKLKLSKARLSAIINHLRSGIGSMRLSVKKSEWSDYYKEFSYSEESIQHKKELVKAWVEKLQPAITWDLGSNTGMFSEIVANISGSVTAFDIDYLAVEKFYLECLSKRTENILPLVLDLSNPSPATGWANLERKSLSDRGPADLLLALALIHHLSISNNLPFNHVAKYLSETGKSLIIEFVPKTDSQSQRLLVTREDVFDNYNQHEFEKAFEEFFQIENREAIRGTDRTLYYMVTKN